MSDKLYRLWLDDDGVLKLRDAEFDMSSFQGWEPINPDQIVNHAAPVPAAPAVESHQEVHELDCQHFRAEIERLKLELRDADILWRDGKQQVAALTAERDKYKNERDEWEQKYVHWVSKEKTR